MQNGIVLSSLGTDIGTSCAPAEDNLNIALKDITVTGRDGRVSQLDQVYIRGSMIRFFIVPDMLQNAPMYVSP